MEKTINIFNINVLRHKNNFEFFGNSVTIIKRKRLGIVDAFFDFDAETFDLVMDMLGFSDAARVSSIIPINCQINDKTLAQLILYCENIKYID